MTETHFDYLRQWDRPRLYARLEEIRPRIDFLLKMHNAKEKTAAFTLAFLAPEVSREELFFSTNAKGEEAVFYGFPEVLETFIHNFCTYLCAEKMMLEFLINEPAP